MSATNHTFRLELPPGWCDQTVHVFAGPEEEGIPHRLVLQIDEQVEESDLEQFATARIDAQRAFQPDGETLRQSAVSLGEGKNAYEWLLGYEGSDGRPLVKRHVFFLERGCGYTFQCTFTRNTIRTIGSQVQQMIERCMFTLPET